MFLFAVPLMGYPGEGEVFDVRHGSGREVAQCGVRECGCLGGGRFDCSLLHTLCR